MKLTHKYKDIILLLILGLVPLLWYGFAPNMLITSDDAGSSIDPVVLIKKRLFAWDNSVNLGIAQDSYFGSIIYYGSEAFFAFVTGSVFTGQKIVTIAWFLIPMLVMYLVIKRIPGFKDKSYMALFAAILFQFNHFQLHAWRVYWRTRFSTYTLLPLTLLFLVNYLEGRTNLVKTAIFFGLSVLLLNGGGSPPLFGANILLIAIVIIYYLFISIGRNFFVTLKRSIFFVVGCTTSAAVFSSFWLFSYLYFSLTTFSQSLENIGGVTSQLAWTNQISQNAGILNLLRNVGLPFWNPTQEVPKLFLTDPIFIAASFIWPILLFACLILAKKTAEKKYLVLVIFFTIAGLAFTTGSHPPFTGFYLFLLNNLPGFIIFRSPLYKFGNLLWFSYAIIFAFSVSSLIAILKNFLSDSKKIPSQIVYLLPTVFISFILVWNFPLADNRFFGWSKVLSIMEQVPQYVLDYKNWLNNSEDLYGRTILLPDSSRTWRQEVYRWKYWSFGSQLLPLATNKTTLSNDATTSGFERLYLDNLYDLLKSSNPAWLNMAQKLGIRYLLLRGDFFYDLDWIPNTQPFVYEEILSKDQNVEKINTFGQWVLYKIKTIPAAGKISAKTQPIFYQTKDNNLPLLFYLFDQEGYSSANMIFIPDSFRPVNTKDTNLIIIPSPADIYLPNIGEQLELAKPKFLPGTFLYFITSKQESDLVKKAKTIQEYNDIFIKLSIARLAELNEFLDTKSSLRNITNVSERFAFLLNKLSENLKKFPKGDKKTDRQIITTLAYLSQQKKLINKWLKEQPDSQTRKVLSDNISQIDNFTKNFPISAEQEAVLNGMTKPFADPEIVFLSADYKWKIPQSGLYKIYINNASLLSNNKSVSINIDDKSVTGKITPGRNKYGWQKVAELQLPPGEPGLEIIADGVKLTSIRQTDLLFMLKNGENKDANAALEITYRKINPTRFAAETSAQTPFYLLLEEKFHPGWKLYVLPKSDSRKSAVNIIQRILNTLNENILTTLFAKPLSEEFHVNVNGYANAWYIDPVKNPIYQNSELIIEYWPQRIFYLGMIVTIVSVAGGIIYLIFVRKKN